jgi:hypothetical protein
MQKKNYFSFRLLKLEMAELNVFWGKRRSSFRVRPWICVFLIFILILLKFRWIRKQWICLLFWFSKIWFLLFLWICNLLPLYTVFLIYISIWEFFAPCFRIQVDLQFGIVCLNMNTNINVKFHIPGNGLISYNSILNQIFIPYIGRKKQVYCF